MPAARYWDGTKWADLSMGTLGGQYVSFIVGDGAATSFTLIHRLGSRNVMVACYRTATPWDEVEVDVERTDLDTITVRTFPTVPAVGELTVVIAAPGTQAALNITMDGWHTVGQPGEPAFQNGWTGSTEGLRFRKYPDGRVVVRGQPGGGTPASVVFTLPVGYRPPRTMYFDALNSAGAAGNYSLVQPDGTVLQNTNAGWLDIAFDTESVLQTASVAAQPLDSVHYVGGSGEPAFTNSWVNYDNNAAVPGSATQRSARFRKDPFGRVRVSGLIKTGAGGTTVFTLPVGYRPANDMGFSALASGGLAQMVVTATGAVQPSNFGSSAVSTYVFLDDIEFDTESVAAYATGTFPYLPVTMDPWHTVGNPGEPAFNSTFKHYDTAGTYTLVGFRKDPNGRVNLKGLVGVSSGTAANPVFMLPVGYRPRTIAIFDTTINGINGMRLDVYPDGSVNVGPFEAGFVPSAGTFITLDGLSFDTESVLQTASVAAQSLDAVHVVGNPGEPAFQNSWVNYGGGMATARFRKDPMGRVRLAGGIKTGASGTIVFTLPVGYRPSSGSVNAIPVTTSGGTGYVSITSAGDVYMSSGSGSASIYADLHGVEFDTESQSSYPSAFVQINAPPKVTSLPVAPVDGQECYFVADAANGILWHLRYNAGSASAYKWEFVGGSRLRAFGGVDSTTSPAGFAWTNVPGGPSVVAPLAGDYEVEWNAVIATTSAAVGDFRWRPSGMGGNIPSGGSTHLGGGAVNGKGSGVLVCTAGQTITLTYATSASNLAFTSYERSLWLKPVRVG